MRRANLKEFRSLFYTPDSAPALNTLRAWIKGKKLPGGIIEASHYFVDLDEYDRATNVRVEVHQRRKELAANPVLEGLL